MKIERKLRIRHLIDDSWVCEFNKGKRFTSDWVGMNSITNINNSISFVQHPVGSGAYYNNCRVDYEVAVQLQLKILASYGMEMEN